MKKSRPTLKRQPITRRKAIELSGLHGTFRIRDSAFSVHYFSTFASSTKNHKEGDGYLDLLSELHPMRERVKASDIKNLNTLLQRDLDDTRIANELIPYLNGNVTKTIGFFPPVLAVLIPRAFISGQGRSSKYPESKKSRGGDICCGEFWEFESLDSFGRLGILKIFSSTEIIVLDGQHRANAFRYLAGQPPQSKLHQSFYSRVPDRGPYQSELPVTLIWFEKESTREVAPTDISRELFVAVNNSAQHVSWARTILLNERGVCELAVNTYYNYLAENAGFSPAKMSLLTGAFDIDVDETATGMPATALTTPVHLYHATRFFFFGVNRYDELTGKATNHPQTNRSRFECVFGSAKYIQTGGGGRIQDLTSPDDQADLRKRITSFYIPLLQSLFSTSKIAELHHQALSRTKEWVYGEKGTASHQEAWEQVLCGGEGLFNQIRRASQREEKAPAVLIYAKSSSEIQKALKEFRLEISKAEKLDSLEVNEAFRLFGTIAAQTGILMALSTFLCTCRGKKNKSGNELATQRLEQLTLKDWVKFFAGFSELYFSNLETRAWVRFQRLFVRLFIPEIKIFQSDPSTSPDYEMIRDLVHKTLSAQFEVKKTIDDDDISNAVVAAKARVVGAFSPFNKDLLVSDLSDKEKACIRDRYSIGKANDASESVPAEDADEEPDKLEI